MKKLLAMLLALVLVLGCLPVLGEDEYVEAEAPEASVEDTIEAAVEEMEVFELGGDEDEPAEEVVEEEGIEEVPESEEALEWDLAALDAGVEALNDDAATGDYVSTNYEVTYSFPETYWDKPANVTVGNDDLGLQKVLYIGDTVKLSINLENDLTVTKWENKSKKLIDFDEETGILKTDKAATAIKTKASDKATVKATLSNKKTVTFTLVLTNPYVPDGVSLPDEPRALFVGQSEDLNGLVSLHFPYMAEGTWVTRDQIYTDHWPKLTFKSSKSAVAKVDSKTFALTGAKAGETVVTVTAVKGVTAQVNYTVYANLKTYRNAKTDKAAAIAAAENLGDDAFTLLPISIERNNKGALICQFFVLNGNGSNSISQINNLNLNIYVTPNDGEKVLAAQYSLATTKVSVKKKNVAVLKLTIPKVAAKKAPDTYVVDDEHCIVAEEYGTVTLDLDGDYPTAKAGKTDILTYVPTPDGFPKVAPSSLSIAAEATTLAVGETTKIVPTFDPAYATGTITWAVSGSGDADVADDGTLTATAAGTVKVTAFTGNLEAECELTIIDEWVYVDNIALSISGEAIEDDEPVQAAPGDSFTVSATMSPENHSIADDDIEWSSSNPLVATVDKGEVTVLKRGETTITATAMDSEKQTASFTVKSDAATDEAYVAKAVEKLLNSTDKDSTETLSVGDQMLVAVRPGDGVAMTGLTSKSSDIASVESGDSCYVVTANKKGSTVLTASFENKETVKITLTVTANNEPSEIKFAQESYDIAVYNTLNLLDELTTDPAFAKDGNTFTWKSATKASASVDANGVVTGLKVANDVAITATASNKVVGTAKVSVHDNTVSYDAPAAGGSVEVAVKSLTIDAKGQLVIALYVVNGSDANITALKNFKLTITYDGNAIVAYENASLTAKVNAGATGTATVTLKATDWVMPDNLDLSQLPEGALTFSTAFDGKAAFTVNEEGVLTGYEGSSAALTIPESYNGTAITAIGAEVFKGNTTLTSVTVQATITEIGASAFEGCTSLTKVTLPDTVEYIREKAFKDCTKLSEMN